MTNKQIMEQMMITLNTINSKLDSLESRVSKLESAPVSSAKTSTKSSKPTTTTKTSAKKSSPAKSSAELVEFKKQDGTVLMVSAKQAAAWNAYRDRVQNRMSLEELKAVPMPKISTKVKTFVKSNPGCSAKQVKEAFPEMRGLRREQLAALKVELGVRAK